MNKENHTQKEKWLYSMGMNVMWDAFRYAAYDENMYLKTALYKLGKWIDEVAKPWGRDGMEVIGHRKYGDLILPPGIERLPDGTTDV